MHVGHSVYQSGVVLGSEASDMAHTEDAVLQFTAIGANPYPVLILKGEEYLMRRRIERMKRSNSIGQTIGKQFEGQLGYLAAEILCKGSSACNLGIHTAIGVNLLEAGMNLTEMPTAGVNGV